jgi:hypothetical protein
LWAAAVLAARKGDLTFGIAFATVGLVFCRRPTRILALVNLTFCGLVCRSFELAQGFAVPDFRPPDVYGDTTAFPWNSPVSCCQRPFLPLGAPLPFETRGH